MNSILVWRPERLNAALKGAFRASLGDVRRQANASSPAPGKARAFVKQIGDERAIAATGGRLGHIFELGRKGGYVIQPGLRTTRGRVAGGSRFQKETTGVRGGSGNIAIKFTKGDGGFARGGFIGGAQKAEPYLYPATVVWAQTYYKRRAAVALAAFAAAGVSSFKGGGK